MPYLSNTKRVIQMETDEYAEFRDASPPQNVMEEVHAGVRLLWKLDREVEQAEAELEKAKKRRNQQKFADLPALMKKLGKLAAFDMEMPDGTVVHVKREEKLSAKLSEGNRTYVFDWMRQHEYSHHISNDVTIPFTAGQEKELEALTNYLKQFPGHVKFATESVIHSSTYTAFCNRVKDKLTPDQQKLFGIHIVDAVDVKVKKTKGL